jgi:RHS repeat-associated protein
MKHSMLLFFALPLLSLPLVAQTQVYSFTVPPPGPGVGYAPNGNLLSYTDNVNGNWTMSYDQLNRLQSAAVATGPYQGLGLALTYDSFGNRLTQTPSGPPSTGPVLTRWANYDSNNRLTTTSQGSCFDANGNNICYDAAGNNVFDGLNQMAYDGENRICAVLANGTITQYLYDAEGRRVAKGHSASNPGALACSMGGTDFVPIETDVLGQSGEQVTQFDGSGNWQHTNVYAAGELLATYDGSGPGLHFHIADPLGSRRVQVSSTGEVELNCANLPFGDNLSCGPGTDATEHHFTGKERDSESGLDYFGARYYGSSMGRFMSPDPAWFVAASVADPQSWNLYAYARNNPLVNIDSDGYDCVYLNNAGTDVDKDQNGNITGIDTNSSRGECSGDATHKGTGGYWVDGTVNLSQSTVFSNNNDVQLSGSITDSAGNTTSTNSYYTSATGHLSGAISWLGYTGLTGTVDLYQLVQNRPTMRMIGPQNPVDVAIGCAGQSGVGVAKDVSGVGLLSDTIDAAMSGSLKPLFNSGDRLNDAGNGADVAEKTAGALEKTLPVAAHFGKALGYFGAGITVAKAGRDFYNCVR